MFLRGGGGRGEEEGEGERGGEDEGGEEGEGGFLKYLHRNSNISIILNR